MKNPETLENQGFRVIFFIVKRRRVANL